VATAKELQRTMGKDAKYLALFKMLGFHRPNKSDYGWKNRMDS
jgi:hypothetical protein